jgi:uncharacterized DUF497 family protein
MSYHLKQLLVWNKAKNRKLREERNVCFEDVVEPFIEERYLDVLANPSRAGQFIFIVKMKEYVHVVPFVIDRRSRIVLKTIFPSRKFNKIYGDKENEK